MLSLIMLDLTEYLDNKDKPHPKTELSKSTNVQESIIQDFKRDSK